MKTLAAALQAHYESGATTLAHCLRVTRPDGAVYAFTTHDADIVSDGVVYRAGPGLDLSNVALTAGLAPDNMELVILYDDDLISRSDLLGGRWDNSDFLLFELNYAAPADGTNVILSGTTGEVKVRREGGYVLEFRSLKQRLQRPIGSVTQKTCRYRLGDDLCTVDLTGYTTAAVAVTSVSDSRSFTASGLAQAADYFKEGSVAFTTGDNAGISRRVKTHGSGGVLTMVAPFPFAVEVGNQFTIIAGCQKRLEDCRDKFNNVLNFGGEPHLVGTDALTALPTPGAG